MHTSFCYGVQVLFGVLFSFLGNFQMNFTTNYFIHSNKTNKFQRLCISIIYWFAVSSHHTFELSINALNRYIHVTYRCECANCWRFEWVYSFCNRRIYIYWNSNANIFLSWTNEIMLRVESVNFVQLVLKVHNVIEIQTHWLNKIKCAGNEKMFFYLI